MALSDYQRIEKAIHFIEKNFQRQPDLKAIAEQVHLSEFHFHRLFRRWAGITPKRFLQFLTVEYAKKRLQECQTILQTSYESGLSGPGRLHDLFVAVESVTPGEYKTHGYGLEVRYGKVESPFGDCLLAITGKGICGLEFVTNVGSQDFLSRLTKNWSQANIIEDQPKVQSIGRQIFSRQTNGTPIPVLLKGTNFQIQVWKALIDIPPGYLSSYEEIAKRIGKPAASRAVGNAVGKNPVSFLIPCHRVIRKTGIFGSYLFGPARKKAMIGWEAARTSSDEESRN